MSKAQQELLGPLKAFWRIKWEGRRVAGYDPRPIPLIVGPSGSGKTALVRHFAALEELPMKDFNVGTWLVSGAKTEPQTLNEIADFLAAGQPWHDGLEFAHGLSIHVVGIVDACKIRVEKTVDRDGIEIGPGRHLSAPELAGLVGETVTLRVLPEGGDNEADCFYRGEKVATLRVVERDGELAGEIKAAQLDRTRELARLRKSLIKTANRMLGSAPSVLPPGEPLSLPLPETGSREDAPLDIPDLPTEDDDEA